MNVLKPYLEPVVRRQQKWRVRTRLLYWWGVVLAISTLFLIRTVFGESISGQLAIGLFGLLLAGTFIILWINTPRNNVNYQQLARDIEVKHPELRATLLTAVEQKPNSASGKYNLLQQRVINEAVLAYEKSQFSQVVPNSWLTALTIGLTGLFTLICLCLVMTILIPLVFDFSTPLASTATIDAIANNTSAKAKIIKVEPGNIEVERGTPLAVLAHFTGKLPSSATLVFSPKDGPARRIELVKNLDDPIFGATLPSVDGSFTYHVEYDRQKSEKFSVAVYEHPALDRADATLDYPSYTKLPNRTIKGSRRLSAVEGTYLSYKFHLNKPVQSARLVSENDEEIELKIHANQPLAELSTLALTQNLTWKLELTDDANRLNKIAPRIEVVVYANKPPKIRISSPHGDLQVSPLEEIDYIAEIEDDFGLGLYGLTYNVNGGDLHNVQLGKDAPGNTKTLAVHLLALETLNVEPDQLINWYFWAEDIGPDGNKRRAYSDMFFAEIRPFEEIFRQGQGQSSQQQQQQQQQQQSPNQQTEQLIKLQKQIINATWKLRRQPATLAADAPVLLQSQKDALGKARALLEKSTDEKTTKFIKNNIKHMEITAKKLAETQGKPEGINKSKKDNP